MATERVALVIGNGAYQNVAQLPNPTNDANAIADVLDGMGFEVIKGVDLDEAGMERLLRQFVSAMKDARIVLFYYSGHGLQVGGKNYLIPVDAALEDEAALDFETIDADKVFGYMGGNERIALAFLDACRDNPFARSLARSAGLSRGGVATGLAVPETLGSGLFIGFSTAPNDTAADGTGGNSPFTAAMIKHLPTPGLEINQVLTRVKADVRAATGNRQRPWTNSDLMADLYLIPAVVEAEIPVAPQPGSTEELVANLDSAIVAGGQSLLLEASDNGKIGAVPFSGTTEWRRSVDDGGSPTLIGKVVIPARNLQVEVILRKNSDASLPASHLMELNFVVADDFVGGSIAGMPGVLLKNEELVQGTPLVGASARVMGNSFLFALSAAPKDVAANLNLLASRRFMDLALIYATGKRAIVTMEKNPAAVALFSGVLAEWQAVSDLRPKSDMVVARSSRNTEPRELILTVSDNTSLEDVLQSNKVGTAALDGLTAALRNVLNSSTMPEGAVLRILLQPHKGSAEDNVERLSIYFPDARTGEIKHAVTAALTDRGNYVLGLPPSDIQLADGTRLGDPEGRIEGPEASGKGDRDRNIVAAN
jgi:hypothetical protein